MDLRSPSELQRRVGATGRTSRSCTCIREASRPAEPTKSQSVIQIQSVTELFESKHIAEMMTRAGRIVQLGTLGEVRITALDRPQTT